MNFSPQIVRSGQRSLDRRGHILINFHTFLYAIRIFADNLCTFDEALFYISLNNNYGFSFPDPSHHDSDHRERWEIERDRDTINCRIVEYIFGVWQHLVEVLWAAEYIHCWIQNAEFYFFFFV